MKFTPSYLCAALFSLSARRSIARCALGVPRGSFSSARRPLFVCARPPVSFPHLPLPRLVPRLAASPFPVRVALLFRYLEGAFCRPPPGTSQRSSDCSFAASSSFLRSSPFPQRVYSTRTSLHSSSPHTGSKRQLVEALSWSQQRV